MATATITPAALRDILNGTVKTVPAPAPVPAAPAVDTAKTDAAIEKSRAARGRKQQRAPQETAVKSGTVSSTDMTIPGFEIVWTDGKPTDAEYRAIVQRDTTNPWYGIVEYVQNQGVGFLEIRRAAGSKEKAPLSRITSAIQRGANLAKKYQVRGETVPANLRNMHKVAAEGLKNEKGVWLIIRLP